ncbi:hypothetical protein AB0C96_20845 [Streptomyces sp. NPDC048506]|uniref:hypothetical protein n=1 Tax=Streptomyces sp. NPDC048506 TaxID=3155028 RepID=UPI00343D4505
MNFRVEAADVEGFAKLVGRAGNDAGQAVSYTKNATITKMAGGKLWDLVAGQHDDHVHDARRTMEKLQDVLRASDAELVKSAHYYQRTDHEQAARLDATYPGSKKGAREHSGGDAGDFSDRADAAAVLKAPGGGDGYLAGHAEEFAMNPVSKTLGTVLDLGSPSAMMIEGSKLIFGFDPYDELNGMIFGEWGGYNDCAEVWSNLGACCSALSDNIRQGNDTLSRTWAGNSADAAWVYFDELAEKLREVKGTFGSLSENYHEAARLVFELGETLKSGLSILADLVVCWLINVIASRAAAFLGPGGMVASAAMMALAAAQLAAIMAKWSELVVAVDTAATAVGAVAAVIATAVAGFSSVREFPVIGSGYDNTAV